MATEYLTNDTDLKAVADAIRAKTGGTDALSFPAGFVSEIGTLRDTSDATAAAAEILANKTAYVRGLKITGTMPSAKQAVPSISVSQDGLITASVQQSAGYVAAGTKSATMQLPTYDGSVS